MSAIEARLKQLGIVLPEPAPAAGNYVPTIIEGNHLFISGQLPFDEKGKMAVTGHLGKNVSPEDGIYAARLCCINILAQASSALNGDLSRIRRCIRVSGYVASSPDFTDQPKIINGASDLMVEILGEPGKHTRIAVGTSALPLGSAVEIDAHFWID